MSCCSNTYNLGCHYYCNQLSFGSSPVTGDVVGVFKSPSGTINQQIEVTEGGELAFDLSLLNEEMLYELSVYFEGEKISIDIDGTDYDCFEFKTEIAGVYVITNNDMETNVITITATGVSSYTNSTLINKEVMLVFTDNAIRIPSDYTFTSSTGTIVFISAIDTGTIIQIQYK